MDMQLLQKPLSHVLLLRRLDDNLDVDIRALLSFFQKRLAIALRSDEHKEWAPFAELNTSALPIVQAGTSGFSVTIDTETWNKLSGVPDGSKVDFAVRSEGNAWHFAMKQLPSRRLLLEVKITRLRSRRTLFRVNIRFNTLVSEIGGLLTKLFGEVRQMDHTREAWKALCELGPIKEVSQEHTRSGCLNVVTIQSPPNCPLWTSLGCFDLTYKANHSSTVTTVLELNLGDGSRSHLPRLSVRFEDDEVIRERIELAFRNGTEDNRPIGPIRSSFGMGNSNSVARALRSLDKAVAHDSGLDALRARQLLLQ